MSIHLKMFRPCALAIFPLVCLAQEARNYQTVIPNSAKTQNGVFKVHTVGPKIYYEIPEREFGKPFLWWTRIVRTPSLLGYANQPVASHIIAWTLRDDRVLLLRGIFDSTITDPKLPIARAVAAISNPTIIMSFPIQARALSGDVVIDVTNLLTTDVPEFSVRPQLKAQGLDSTRSFVERISDFATNIEVEATYTYTAPVGALAPINSGIALTSSMPPGSASLLLHHSMIRLPDQPMQPRLADPRVGFMTSEGLDFGLPTSQEPSRKFACRWRLEKQNPAAAVSEPVKPIDIYVDPATPAKWVPYVKKGIEDWRLAFEGAGFRNAINAREVPADDKNWSVGDARFTVVTWQALTAPLAFTGPVIDPRSGEIVNAQIQIFHGIVDRMAGNYFVQAGPLDPRARRWPLPDEVSGEFIRYVVAHEVGHALGLSHNMKASAMYPTEKLRDRQWVRKMGYSPSIEDYSRFNYVAQPEDGFEPEELMPSIGPYDRWVVHWGYSVFANGKKDGDDHASLDAWAREQERSPWLRWKTENGEPADPAERMEAVGNADPILSTMLGLKNLRRVMEMLIPATENQNWRDLESLYKRVLGQWTNEMLTVAWWVGGMNGEEKVRVSDGVRFTTVPKKIQRAAVIFLNQNAFETPRFLIRNEVIRRIEPFGASDHILEAQGWVLWTLVSSLRLNRMLEQEEMDGSAAYGPSEFISDLRKGVWKELELGSHIDLWRRNLQLSYVELMAARLYAPGGKKLSAIIRGDLMNLSANLARTLERSELDRITRTHLQEVSREIRTILDSKLPPTPQPPELAEPKYFPLR